MDKQIKILPFVCGSIKDPMSRARYDVYSYLVEHPKHGKVIIDTGLNADYAATWPKYLIDMLKPQIPEEKTLCAQLKQMNIRPEDIDVVFMTHLDADVNSALKDFAPYAKRIVMAEHEYFYSCRTVYKLRQPTCLWMDYLNKIERIYYRAIKIGPQGRGFDLFGDESFIAVHLPGHTEGQLAVMVSNGNNGRVLSHDGLNYGGNYVLFSSDSVFKPMTFDKKGQAKAVKWVDELRNDRECLKIYPSHSDAPVDSAFFFE